MLSDILKRFTSAQPSVLHSTTKIEQKPQLSDTNKENAFNFQILPFGTE